MTENCVFFAKKTSKRKKKTYTCLASTKNTYR